MKKVYIVTAGCYSDYHISAVFENRNNAETFCKIQKKYNKWDDDYRIEEYNIGENSEYLGKTFFNVCIYTDDYTITISSVDYANIDMNKINLVEECDYWYNVIVSVPVTHKEPEKLAKKIATDLVAEYKAKKEGIS
jgi:hypothetical protein